MGNSESCFCYKDGMKKDRDFLIMGTEVRNQLVSLLKLQAIWRGYSFRKSFLSSIKTVIPPAKKNKKFQDKHFSSTTLADKQITTVSAFPSAKFDNSQLIEVDHFVEKVTQKVSEVEKSLGPFVIEEKEASLINNESLIKRKAIFIEDEKGFYVGTWNRNGQREGFGSFFLSDGGKKEGFYMNDMLNYRARIINAQGDFFEGEMKDNKAHGFGKFVSSKGVIFVGKWENDKQNGFGEEIYPDGSRYEGNYINGLKNGKGKFIWKDGATYEGDILMNNIEGSGTYKWKDGRVYQGTWKNNKMEGQGLFIWPDQKKYIGEYSNDKKSGYGTFIWPDGKKYEGAWFNGKQNGYGILTNKGVKKYGEWKNGKKQRWIDEDNSSNFHEIFDKILQNFSDQEIFLKVDLRKSYNK